VITLRELAFHPIACLTRRRAAESSAAEHVVDHYERARRAQLDALAAAGKCLARAGADANLRYWPAERGSRVLLEHRRRQRVTHARARA
jgi:hypothetical protein